jgi:hypothetical protein
MDLTIDGSEAAEESVVEHRESVSANPVPGRVKVSGFERVENGLDAIKLSVAVLTRDAVQQSLNLH